MENEIEQSNAKISNEDLSAIKQKIKDKITSDSKRAKKREENLNPYKKYDYSNTLLQFSGFQLAQVRAYP